MRQHLRHGGTTVRLTNIQTVRDRNGKPRRYLRVKGQKLVPLPDLPLDHPDFLAAWSAAMKAAKGRPARPAPGSIAALCGAFLRSPTFLAHSTGYQAILRRHVMAIEARAGEAQARHLAARHIAVDLAGLTGGAAQSRFKAWRALVVHGLDAGILTADPTEGVKRPKPARTDGHAPWTAVEIEAFRARWPIGTVQRASSAFTITPRKAFDELMEELRRFGAVSPVVSTNAPLRQDGTPYADALDDPLPDPGVAVYFVRKKRLVCLACDTYRLPFENVRALGLSIKALRDMDRWGAGQVLDQAFEGFTALPPPDAMGAVGESAWWVVLGVEPTATRDQIADAYKARARAAGGASVELNAAKEAGLRARSN